MPPIKLIIVLKTYVLTGLEAWLFNLAIISILWYQVIGYIVSIPL